MKLTLETISGRVAIRLDGRSICDDAAAIALQIDGASSSPTTSRVEPSPDGVVVLATFALVDHPEQSIDLRQIFRVSAGRVDRQLLIARRTLKQPTALRSVTLRHIGLAGDHASGATWSIPMARLRPGTPTADVLNRPSRFPSHKPTTAGCDVCTSAPDTGVGVVTFQSDNLHVSLTPRPRECPVKTYLFGENNRVVVEHVFQPEQWLTAGEQEIELASQTLLAAKEPWNNALPAVGALWAEQGFSPPADRPAWAASASVLEIDLVHYNGLCGVIDRLDEIHANGFNTLYLMPWHVGGYGTIDYEQVDPRFGSADDLKALTAAAHERGLRVLFDLLVNIASPKSDYAKDHPDRFYRAADGTPMSHPSWGNLCFDPASQGFRRFLIGYAERCCREWHADGFRVDAVAYRGGLWNNAPGVQPHQHAHAVFSLVGQIRSAIRAINPQAILMAECFGPAQVPVSDLVCYQWVDWLDWMLAGVSDGSLSGADLQRVLAEQFLAMPPRTWFTLYTHTHDSLAFVKRDIDTPAVAAVFSTLALLGAGLMQFAGGWKMRPRPSGVEAEWYRPLLQTRSALGGVAGDQVQFLPSPAPSLFIARRPSERGRVRVLSNFGSTPLNVPDLPRLYSRLDSPAGQILPLDTLVLIDAAQ